MPLRILTFNWHESYIHLLAKTGHDFDVVQKEKAGMYGWIRAIRPVPGNCRLVSETEARARLTAGAYDRIIAHNLEDLLFVREFDTPKVMLFHNKLSTEIALSGGPVDKAAYLAQVKRLFTETANLSLVFISEAKRLDWGFAGEIVLPGVDPADYGGYCGEEPRVLRVGNGLKERDIMLGYTVQERVVGGLPSTILGLNPQIPEACLPGDWDAYRGFLRRHRVYLNTTVDPYEDGYNLAMLEAMATGMPIVSTANRSTPIEDGVNGYVSKDEGELKARLVSLLEDRSLAVSVGSRARQTVLDRFPVRAFLERWAAVLGDGPVRARAVVPRAEPAGRRRVLMSYTSNPQTTGAYLEKALRRRNDVVTYGPCIPDDVLTLWDMEEIRSRVTRHDIPYFTEDVNEVLNRLPKGWSPDLFLWVESGIQFPLEAVEALPCLTACYLIDSHLNLERHLEIAKRFHLVFVAQREYLPRFRDAGVERVHWIPLACDPEVHAKSDGEKAFEVAFVGSMGPLNRRRNALLARLAERFPLYVDRCFLEQMAGTFSRSKIVFNASVKNDLNMRVFEAMAAGSLLVTDEAPGSGLTDLFQDRRHLALYRSEVELFERIGHYLRNETEREAIAAEGRREVLRRHTYDHRAQEMVDVMNRLDEERLLPKRGVWSSPTTSESLRARCEEPAWPGEPCELPVSESGRHAAPGPEGDAESNPYAAGPTSRGRPLSDYYKRSRSELAGLIPEDAERILDIGCGGGHLGKLLKERSPRREIWGVEVFPEACEEARKWLDRVFLADACRWEPPVEKGYFDVLVFSDVLEHLVDPKTALERYLPWLRPAGSVVLSIPNVRFWGVVQHLVEGYWTYQDEGLLDRDHVRFFTWAEVRRLLECCGLECTEVRSNLDSRCPDVPAGKTADLRLGRITIHDLEPEDLREFFVFQYLVRAARTRESLLVEARRLEASGRIAGAFGLYAGLVARDGGDAAMARKLSQAWTTAEERRQASHLIEACLSVRPANIDLLIASSRLLVEEGRPEDAAQRLERVLFYMPDHAEARSRLEELGVRS